MFKNLIKIIILIVIILGGWVLVRDQLPLKAQDSQAAQFMDGAIVYVVKKSKPLRDTEIVATLINGVFPIDYSDKIKIVSAKQLALLVNSRRKDSTKPPLLFLIYDLNCYRCDEVFASVNEAAARNDENLKVVAVATSTSKEDLIEYLQTIRRGVVFKPLMLNPNDEVQLPKYLSKVGIIYDKNPTLIKVEQGGKIKKFNTAIDTYVPGGLNQWLGR